jgi:uncharacterized protein (DUF2147 family)
MFMAIWDLNFIQKGLVNIGWVNGSILLFPTTCTTSILEEIMDCILLYGTVGCIHRMKIMIVLLKKLHPGKRSVKLNKSTIRYKPMLWLVLFQLISTAVSSQVRADDIVGVWLTGGKEPAKIQIFGSYDKYYGKIIWLKNPMENGKPRVDANNPDKAKRHYQIVGLVILNGFQFDGKDEWDGGKISDPENGKTYKCYMSLKDKNTLKVRGYIGVSLLGRTETWSRVN